MSPVTHWLASWVVAAHATRNPRDVRLVTRVGVLGDLAVVAVLRGWWSQLRNRKRGAGAGLALVGALIFCGDIHAAEPGLRWKECLGQPAAWYASAEARRIADNVMRYQRASGGWPKNVEMAATLSEAARARIAQDRDQTDSTIDNGATTTQLRFLAGVQAVAPRPEIASAIQRGLDYLLAAQYPNGGWPQFWPKPRGYASHITFNDDAMVNVLALLRVVAAGEAGFAFVDADRKSRAKRAVDRGVACILRCQVIMNGRRTVWCAQHDERTLQPAGARSYEHPSLSGGESVGIVRFLMRLDSPDPSVVEAVEAAVAWFRESRLTGIRVVRKPDPKLAKGYDAVVLSDAGAPPLWARFYEIGTNRPIFSGRDGVIKTRLADIEYERRTGYSWYTTAPARLLAEEYPAWRRRLGATDTGSDPAP